MLATRCRGVCSGWVSVEWMEIVLTLEVLRLFLMKMKMSISGIQRHNILKKTVSSVAPSISFFLSLFLSVSLSLSLYLFITHINTNIHSLTLTHTHTLFFIYHFSASLLSVIATSFSSGTRSKKESVVNN